MRILLIHNEAKYFGGAEKVLGYYLSGAESAEDVFAVAAVRGSRMMELMPPEMQRVGIGDNGRFSLLRLGQQARGILAFRRQFPFDLVHGWAARDWELSALVGWLARRPAIGTLHDHPAASFITPARRRLMRWSAALGLRQVACVSEAVRVACVGAGYPAETLQVVHNGLPPGLAVPRGPATGVCRLGFLGIFSERKGLRDLFAMLAEFATLTTAPWELKLAGGAQGGSDDQMLAELRQRYSRAAWWPQVKWCGWVENPRNFLSTVDLLVVPSNEFDPLPTVLLEAGQMGVPALAARVGGVAEMVHDGSTGWLFEPGDWARAAAILVNLVANPAAISLAGEAAQRRMGEAFTLPKMIAQYRELYSSSLRHGH
jgi:glycosyltransferase involved in cell wall biosynthesis